MERREKDEGQARENNKGENNKKREIEGQEDRHTDRPR